jgi:hypothetical protein
MTKFLDIYGLFLASLENRPWRGFLGRTFIFHKKIFDFFVENKRSP